MNPELEAEVDAALERAKRFKLIPVAWPERWQCLRDAVAIAMRHHPHDLPPRMEDEPLEEWTGKVEQKFGVRLEIVLPGDPLPEREGWVCVVETDKPETTHAVVAFGSRSLDKWYPYAVEDMVCGLRIRPAAL
jgi:hypothetical protein